MYHALYLANKAKKFGEIPIGSVVILKDNIIGEGWNQSIKKNDPSAHAEILALRSAGKNINNYRLLNTEIYTTIEPCIMCIGAIINARVSRLIFGARKTKKINFFTKDLLNNCNLNHKISLTEGILEENCKKIINKFFSKIRKKNKNKFLCF
ncbi:yfhC [Wigglesworthia glossinidia endosymbiont of Glossina brevipalpis]|uniref:tRNA-specific adenosine deaminase n=1 Tax=Wigglesworthia glossinidia brevipalpis TaxID=36870 RepID=Q8D363_WIGBR|nr:yfhC [Wigglesworthia glossinidia endosymbiont of Glossina brevipalpis]